MTASSPMSVIPFEAVRDEVSVSNSPNDTARSLTKIQLPQRRYHSAALSQIQQAGAKSSDTFVPQVIVAERYPCAERVVGECACVIRSMDTSALLPASRLFSITSRPT